MFSYTSVHSPMTTTVFFGTTGDKCVRCQSSTAPLYGLYCHESDPFHCQNCLTKAWYEVAGDIVPCPTCGKNCGFIPVPSIEEYYNNLDSDDTNDLLETKEGRDYMNHSIAFSAFEARDLLEHVYISAEDKILNPVELGGASNHQTSFYDNIVHNPIYMGILIEITGVPKMMTTPPELEEDLLQVLNNIMLRQTATDFELLKQIHDNWIRIIKSYVDVLAWIHLERLTPCPLETLKDWNKVYNKRLVAN